MFFFLTRTVQATCNTIGRHVGSYTNVVPATIRVGGVKNSQETLVVITKNGRAIDI